MKILVSGYILTNFLFRHEVPSFYHPRTGLKNKGHAQYWEKTEKGIKYNLFFLLTKILNKCEYNARRDWMMNRRKRELEKGNENKFLVSEENVSLFFFLFLI